MRVRPGFGETLPALLRRRHGIPETTTLLAAGALAALLVAAFLVLRDPLDGKTQRVHRGTPVFNTLYRKGLVRPVAPHRGELQRYEAHRGALRLSVTVRRLELPAYRGDVAGTLPVYAERHIAVLERTIPGFALRDEGKARVATAPGYQIGFTYGTPARPGTGRDVLLVPDEPRARAGVVITLRQERGSRRPGAAGRKLAAAMRSAFRSLKFGADRDD